MVGWPEGIAAFIFDLDGVIFDSERAVYAEWKRVADKYGFTIDYDMYIKCIGVNAPTCRRIFLDFYGENFPYDAYSEERRRNFHERYGHGNLPLKPGVVGLLESLKAGGAGIAIASSTRTRTVREEIQDAGLLGYFDEIIGGDQVERSKPAPDIFLKAAEKLGAAPACCCVVEDSYNGILAASAAGMFPVMVPDLLPPTDEMRQKAGCILNSLTELQDVWEREGRRQP